MTHLNDKFLKSITKLLVGKIALLACVLLFVALAIQGYILQSDTRKHFNELAEQIYNSNAPMIALALWDIEPETMQFQVNQLIKRPEIGYVKLKSMTGQIFEAGDILLADRDAFKIVKINQPGNPNSEIGELKIILDPGYFWREFLRRGLEIALSYLLLLVSICLLIFFMLKKNLVEPLKNIATFVSELNSENLSEYFNSNPITSEIAKLEDGISNLQMDLQKHIEHLNELIVERTNNQERLELANQESEAANIAKSQFLATISHELRTPLNGILGMSQILLEQNLNNSVCREYAQQIIDSSKALNTLVDDLLDITQIEANKLSLRVEPCNIHDLSRDVLSFFEQYAKAKNLDVKIELLGSSNQIYRTDPLRLRQMLSNLISNAIKFTEKGYVYLRLEEIQRTGVEAILKFSVIDSGIGIEKDKQHLLFKRFSQIDSSNSRKFMGAGLGLSIVQSLAERMGGLVGFESEPDKGSCFWFTIQTITLEDGGMLTLNPPLFPPSISSSTVNKDHDENELMPSDCTGLPTQNIVFIAEDNQINQIILRNLLERMHLDFVCFNNGLEIVDAIKKGSPKPKLILLDMQMPIMDGLEATKAIRNFEKNTLAPKIPIICLTAGLINKSIEECTQSGIDEVLIKPVDLDELREIILEKIA